MTEIAFTVFGTAQAAGSKRGFKNPKTGRIIITDANPDSKRWKDQVAQQAGLVMAGREPLRGPLSVRFLFFVKRPKGHYGKKGLLPSAPAYPATRPDVLKLARGVEDALSGIVYGDDGQIVSEMLAKLYGTERVEISICPLESQVAELPDVEQTSLLAETRRTRELPV